MVSSRWQKQNKTFLYLGQAILITIYLIIGVLFNTLGLERNGGTLLIFILVTIIAITFAFALMKLQANSLTRVLKMEHETAVRAVRVMLKEKHILYNWQTEKDQTQFDFPGHGLTMSVQSYFLHNLILSSKNNPQPATLVTLHELDANNQRFAKTLADAIDEMAKQQPDNWVM